MAQEDQFDHGSRPSAAALLWLAAGVSVVLLAYTLTVGAALNSGREEERVFATLLSLFLLWRVSRGSRSAWVVMLALGSFGLLVLVAATVSVEPYAVGLGLLSAAELAILLSSPVRRHVGRPVPAAPSLSV